MLGSISGACRFALSLLCLCSQTSSDKSRQRQDTQTYGYDNTMYIPTFPCYWEVKYFEARYASKSQNLDKYLQICGTQKFQGKSSSYTSSEYLLNLRDRGSLRCLIVFFFSRIFTAFGKPLEELRKPTSLEELSELNDSTEESSKNKTAVSADKEVRGACKKGSG